MESTSSQNLAAIPSWRTYFFVCLYVSTSILSSLADLSIVYGLSSLIKPEDSRSQQMSALLTSSNFIWIAFAIIILSLLLKVLSLRLLSTVAAMLSVNLYTNYVNSISSDDYQKITQTDHISLKNHLSTKALTIYGGIAGPILSLFSASMSIVVFSLLLFWQTGPLFILLVVACSLMYLIFYKALSRIDNTVSNSYAENLNQLGAFSEYITSDIIHLFLRNRFRAELIAVRNIYSNCIRLSADHTFLTSLPKNFIESFIFLVILFVTIGNTASSSSLDSSKLLIIALSGLRILPSLQAVFSALRQYNFYKPLLNDYKDLILMPLSKLKHLQFR